MLANYHSHTHYCDGAEHPEAYAQMAMKKNLFAYGYSSHAPVNFETDWNIKKSELQNYISDIQKIKTKYEGELEIYLGLEIDYIPGISGRFKYANAPAELDYFIGSIHFVDGFNDNTPWNIDTSKELFDKGLQRIFSNNFRSAAERFYDITREMIINENPTILGHMDKIKMFASRQNDFNENEPWYKRAVMNTLKAAQKQGTIVEINTRGYYRYHQPDLYPSLWIIELMKEMNIPMVLSSDAHHPDEIIEGFDFALAEIKKIGVNELSVLKKGNWQSQKI